MLFPPSLPYKLTPFFQTVLRSSCPRKRKRATTHPSNNKPIDIQSHNSMNAPISDRPCSHIATLSQSGLIYRDRVPIKLTSQLCNPKNILMRPTWQHYRRAFTYAATVPGESEAPYKILKGFRCDSKLDVAWCNTECPPSSYVYYQRANHETVSRYRRVTLNC